MRENKDQTIARLEKVIEAQKKEMSEVKKDRKRLNYAVDRLERQIQKLSANSSKEDAKRMRELESPIEELKSVNTKYEAQLLAIPKTQCANKDNDKHVYSLKISWTDSHNIDMAKIEFLEKFFKELCLERIGKEEVKFPYHVEVTIEYRFIGSRDSYQQLKMCAMAILMVYNDHKIYIHGKEIEWLTP